MTGADVFMINLDFRMKLVISGSRFLQSKTYRPIG